MKLHSLASTLLILSLLSSSWGLAQERCADVFDRPSTILQRMVPESTMPLSEPLKARLRQHPIWQWAQTVPDEGKGLSFIFRGVYQRDFKTSDGLKGEAQQSGLIIKYLQLLFPKAQLRSHAVTAEGDRVSVPRGTKGIEVYVTDIGESGLPRNVEAHKVLNMGILKPGNPGAFGSTRSEQRRQWGIPQNSKVVSLYIQNEKLFRIEGDELIAELRRALDIDILIISFGNIRENGFKPSVKSFKTDNGVSSSFKKQLLLSKTSPEDLADGQTTFIYNDTIGFMPQTYAVADIAVVVGPINFMQPLNVGTKTIAIFPANESGRGYDPVALKRLTDTAETSGGFKSHEGLQNFAPAVESVMAGPNPTSPAYKSQNNERSPFDIALDTLMNVIVRQYE